jgi:FkbM family methyltransferase
MKNYVTFFNIGAYIGETTQAMVELFEELKIDYRTFEFEPILKYADMIKEKFKDNKDVTVIPVALSSKRGRYPLYKCPRDDGSSLHSTKWNVNPDDYEMVNCDIFSEWYNKNVEYKNDNEIYIIKSSINGGEFEFFLDLINSGLNKTIDIYCGKIYGNLNKLTHLDDKYVNDFKKFLVKNNIIEIDLTCYSMHNMSIVKERLLKLMEEN